MSPECWESTWARGPSQCTFSALFFPEAVGGRRECQHEEMVGSRDGIAPVTPLRAGGLSTSPPERTVSTVRKVPRREKDRHRQSHTSARAHTQQERNTHCVRHSFIRSFVHSFVRSFVRSFIRPSVRPSVRPFVRSFVQKGHSARAARARTSVTWITTRTVVQPSRFKRSAYACPLSSALLRLVVRSPVTFAVRTVLAYNLSLCLRELQRTCWIRILRGLRTVVLLRYITGFLLLCVSRFPWFWCSCHVVGFLSGNASYHDPNVSTGGMTIFAGVQDARRP